MKMEKLLHRRIERYHTLAESQWCLSLTSNCFANEAATTARGTDSLQSMGCKESDTAKEVLTHIYTHYL